MQYIESRKYYTCIKCKEVIPCRYNSFKDTKNLKAFLREHNKHTVSLLTKKELQELSNKRFREFNYKIKTGDLLVQNC